MYIVYVLHSKRYKKIYIGYTSNLEKRIIQHNITATKGYTTKFRPWVVVFTEEYSTKKEAMNREKQLKTASGRRYVWERIRD